MTTQYELYRWDREDLGGHITVYVENDTVMIEDYTIGKTCEDFFGTDDHEYKITIDRAGAEVILAHVGAPVDGSPTEALGAWLATNMTGSSDVISRLKELAKSAGAKVKEFIW